MLVPCCALIASYGLIGTTAFRHLLGLLSTATLATYFLIVPPCDLAVTAGDVSHHIMVLESMVSTCGVLFNIVYFLVFVAFGKRVFQQRTAGDWLSLQLIISGALIAESTWLFTALIVLALLIHLRVSQADVYQVSRKQDRFFLVQSYTVIAMLVTVAFFGAQHLVMGITQFSDLINAAQIMPRWLKILSSVFMMVMLGAFPFHVWVKPLFAAPARYGLAVITRITIGFVVWCKLYPLIFSGDVFLEQLLTYGCGANLLYAAFLLFGERKLSQIVSSLYLFHVPLLILAVKVSGKGEIVDFVLDFANITVAISGLLIILGMLRDRLGAENLDSASGLGISYPLLGISFLVGVLSLVGFPGTLGFICSELVLHHLAESTWPVAAAFILTIALNGYSSFRIFGESFYGDPAQTYRVLFQPVTREKLALAVLVSFLFFSGFAPQIIAVVNALLQG